MSRVWNIREQAEIARRSFDARPAWQKSISYFAGTNNVCTLCGGSKVVPSGDPEFPMQPCQCVHPK
jgi:hypothetical protein